jgi:hypothetical protein
LEGDEMNNGKWSGRLAAVEERMTELEMIVTQHHKPPSRLGAAIRFLVQHQDVIAEMIERYKAKALRAMIGYKRKSTGNGRTHRIRIAAASLCIQSAE